MSNIKPLTPTMLRRRCDPDQFTFGTTAELEDLEEIIGQERAVTAARFGVGIQREGYNLFVLGPPGIGKHSFAQAFLEQEASAKSLPADWCYVNNFEQPHRPRALQLPSGQGVRLRQDMFHLVEELRTSIPAVFESEDYRTRRQVIEEEFVERGEKALESLEQQARERDLNMIRTPAGLAFAPIRDGRVIGSDEFQKLPPAEQERIKMAVNELQQQSQAIIRQAPQWERELKNRLKELNREVTLLAVGHLIDELRDRYSDLPNIVDYLNAVQQDVIENVDDFRATDETPPAMLMGMSLPRSLPDSLPFRRYQVNVLVDHSNNHGAPIVYEDHPTHHNLVGQVEHMVAPMGALVTDFNLIKAGALHQANGGYLLLDARKVLQQPYAWEQLKRALCAREIRIESLGQIFGLVSTVSLEPEPIPLDVKIILMGERLLYYLLYEFDPDFRELFKVEVDFEEQMARNPENDLLYARLIGTLARKEGLRHFDRTAVARVIEQSARLANDAQKLSTRMQSIADLLRETDYWAGQAGHELVSAADVQRAIDTQIYRAGRIRERLQEEIQRETILIDTVGEKIGQINGLSVIELGDFSFGRPSRITARIWLGKGEVVDIEREVELGGPLHSKGVFILSSFLGARFAMDRPLSLSASLVFEQSYSGVEGDSASSAELYALLSALAEAPLKQSLAVTGSVNQHGRVQVIGGVNEKIEGFFDVCRARGLTGEQGVLIPAANVKHLMLRQDLVEAVAAGQFHIYPVETIDQGIEILTGLPAGERDETGNFPEGSINRRVEERLAAMAESWQMYNAPAIAQEVSSHDEQSEP
jgi:lon-related putative ATP-dependent protease